MMTLLDVIEALNTFSEEATIYAFEPWNCKSLAVVGHEEEDGSPPEEAKQNHLKYFLEVAIAREFLEDWEEGRGSQMGSSDRCERLIRYAEDDA